MIDAFSLEGLNKAPSTFNPEKLLWLNQHYIKTMPAQELGQRLPVYLERIGVETSSGPHIPK